MVPNGMTALFDAIGNAINMTINHVKKERPLTHDLIGLILKGLETSIERVLIPINIPYIRMNTGLPIFIDWKHHAFKYDEIIMWKKRINLAQKFYEISIFEQQREILMNINKIDFISHILIEKKELNPKCLNLINHEKFALINASTCYELN